MVTWYNILSDLRSVVLQLEWSRERKMVVRIDTRVPRLRRCWTWVTGKNRVIRATGR